MRTEIVVCEECRSRFNVAIGFINAAVRGTCDVCATNDAHMSLKIDKKLGAEKQLRDLREKYKQAKRGPADKKHRQR